MAAKTLENETRLVPASIAMIYTNNNKTNYELAYTIIEDPGTTVVVILAGTRENFYEELNRYMKHAPHKS